MHQLRDVVVLLPGILGSRLTRDGRDVWGLSGGAILKGLLSLGGSINALMLSDDSTDPDKAADGVSADALLDDVHLIPGLWKIDGYTKVANAIKKQFDVEDGANFFKFPYDWRRDNRIAAKQLAAKTKAWLAAWRQRPGNADAKLILIGHSMGGLVSRYFLEVLEGWRDTRMLITFGTPFRGSLNALNTLANGMKVGVGPLGIDLSPLAQSLPSIHQLLPIYPCYDPGNGELARCHEVDGIGTLDRAKAEAANAFHREIEDAVARHEKDTTYLSNRYGIHPIVGRKQRTFQSARSRNGKVEMLATWEGEDLEGDGTVPRVSATPIELGNKNREMFDAELHASLQNADSALVNVAGLLSGIDTNADQFRVALPGAGVPVRLVVDDAYVSTTPVRMLVQPEESWVDLEATLVDAGANREVATVPVEPSGSAERVLSFPNVQPGTYRVTVHGNGASPVTDVFLVM